MPSFSSIIAGFYMLAAAADGSPTPAVEATPTAVTIAPTPVPVTAAVASPWSPTRWLARTGWAPEFHTFFLVLSILIALAAVVIYFYFYQRRFKEHTLHARLAERTSLILTAFASGGLLFLFFALAQLQLLSWPIWLLLGLVGFIAFVVYAAYYYVTVYPARLAQYNLELERAKYLPKGRTKGPAYTPPMKRNQKQAKNKKKK